jgi:trehalose 6-phosphate synthase/phosphatase
VDPELASARANQLHETLRDFVSNTSIALLEGDKTIEVKNVEVNKGIAALDWISRRKWDFILAIGDDKTDEDTFGILPESAYSIKVGFDSSQAKLHVQSYNESRSLLKDFSKNK